MPKDDRDILEVLKAELDFIEKGGYGRSVRTPWKPTSIFQDSLTCINFGDPKLSRPCDECLLMEFVPPDRRSESVPCHRIPLNQSGETAESMSQRGHQEELEEAVKNWLRATISQLEEAQQISLQKRPWQKQRMGESERKRVLVVDDDEHVLIALQALLENEGYETSTAWSGQEALRLLRLGTFNLILLDDYLPDVTSEEIFRELQGMSVKTPVLLMQSASLTDDSAVRYARLGVSYFVSKRKPEEIAGLVRNYLSYSKGLATCA